MIVLNRCLLINKYDIWLWEKYTKYYVSICIYRIVNLARNCYKMEKHLKILTKYLFSKLKKIYHSFFCLSMHSAQNAQGNKTFESIPFGNATSKTCCHLLPLKRKEKILNWSWKPVNVIVSIVSHLNLNFLIF